MVEVVVIGAGPYGLAIAAHLRTLGVPHRIFGRPMQSWVANMPEGMYLKSAPVASSIAAHEPDHQLADYYAFLNQPFPSERDAIPLADFVAYGVWFQERQVPDLEADEVVQVTGQAGRFTVSLSTGEVVDATNVVVATGHLPYAFVPDVLRPAGPPGLGSAVGVSHASEHAGFAAFTGKRVLVVGSGQSALESAALLAESGAQVELVARAHRLLWAGVPTSTPFPGYQLLKPPSHLGPGWSHRALTDVPGLVRHLPASVRLRLMRQVLGPSGSFWLRDRFEGAVRVTLEANVRGVAYRDGSGVIVSLATAGGLEKREVDHVVAGTGYRIDISALSFLDSTLRSAVRCIGGAPVLGPTFESSVQGLYFTGLTAGPTFGPYMRFVAGTAFAGPRISTALARAQHRPGR